MHSISDLTTYCRKTTGDVPAKLVGASTTIVGTQMYLFGGRMITEGRMLADLYVFDLESFNWVKIEPNPEDDVPSARYFHSADSWNNQLVIFGGMGNKINSSNPEDLRVLNDVRFFDISTSRWVPPTSQTSETGSDSVVPKARYAHLSSVTSNRLFIIGGQDLSNVWLDDICIYDLIGKAWKQRRNYTRHCGTYRSVAVSADKCVRIPQDELRASQSPSNLGAPGTRFKSDKSPPASSNFTTPNSLMHLPYSTQSSEDYPSNIYLYSNYNFTAVKRELEVLSPLPDADFTVHDHSSSMGGVAFPPGLRFPTGAILGTHLIVAGTYLAHTYQSYSIWALDLRTMTWSRVDSGKVLSSGSWFRGCLWADSNKFLVFGNRRGNLVDDYNRRLLSWDHVAVIDLEAFGIYQAPPLALDISMQELGLAAFEEDLLTDFEIICDDDRKVRCSRKVLESRWPWFKDHMDKFRQNATKTMETLPTSPAHIPLSDVPGAPSAQDNRIDPRLTPRSFQLSEPYPITVALLQYFYTLALVTPLQHAPAVLSQLLVLSSTYEIRHLESLVKHAMHLALSNSTSVGVYEVATVCGCRSLQIRALKLVMSYSQKRAGRPRRNTESGGGGGGSGSHASGSGAGRSSGGAGGHNPSAGRPRGTSDAHLRGPPDSQHIVAGFNRAMNNMNGVTVTDRNPSAVEMSPSAYSSPLLSIYPPRDSSLQRSTTAVSMTTDSEIRCLAEFLSPVVIDDEDGSVIAPLRRLRLEIPNTIPRRGPSTDVSSPHSPLSPPSQMTSVSDTEISPDGSGAGYPPFRSLVRRVPRGYATDGSDTPSLVSSASHSSLGSPGWSGRRRRSSPVSPSSAGETLAAPHLAMVSERQPSDHGLDHWHHDSVDSTATFASVKTIKNHHWGAPPAEPPPPLPGHSLTSPAFSPPSLNLAAPLDLSQYDSKSQATPSTISGGWDDSKSVVPRLNRTSTSTCSTVSSNSSSRFGGRGLRRISREINKPPKSPKSPKGRSSFQTITETLRMETNFPVDKKVRKAEAKRRRKALARERTERLAADLKARNITDREQAKLLQPRVPKPLERETPNVFGGAFTAYT